MELVEASIFTKQVTALLSDEEYGEFQARLAANSPKTAGFGKDCNATVVDGRALENQGAAKSMSAAMHSGLGSLIKGGGGVRKIKIRVAVGRRGKRGSARVMYYWAVRRDLILLLFGIARATRRISLPGRWPNSPRL